MRELHQAELDFVLGGHIDGQNDPYSLDGSCGSQAKSACGSRGVKSVQSSTSSKCKNGGLSLGKGGLQVGGKSQSSEATCNYECGDESQDDGGDGGDNDNSNDNDGGNDSGGG